MDKEIIERTEAAPAEDWRLTIPEDWTVTVRDEDGNRREIPLREHPSLAKYASKDDAVKALVHAQRLIGRHPGGSEVPEDPEGYELPDMDLPEGFELDEELGALFRTKALELGLSAPQARGLYEWFLPLNVAAFERMHRERTEERERELQTLRAVHRGELEQVVESARQAALALGGEELLEALERTGAGDRAAVVSAFARMAPLLLEGRLRGADGPASRSLSEEKLVEMMRDPRYADPVRRDPAFVRRITEGFERLYPGRYEPGSRV